jgi:superfamily II DNA or RNA helicase
MINKAIFDQIIALNDQELQKNSNFQDGSSLFVNGRVTSAEWIEFGDSLCLNIKVQKYLVTILSHSDDGLTIICENCSKSELCRHAIAVLIMIRQLCSQRIFLPDNVLTKRAALMAQLRLRQYFEVAGIPALVYPELSLHMRPRGYVYYLADWDLDVYYFEKGVLRHLNFNEGWFKQLFEHAIKNNHEFLTALCNQKKLNTSVYIHTKEGSHQVMTFNAKANLQPQVIVDGANSNVLTAQCVGHAGAGLVTNFVRLDRDYYYNIATKELGTIKLRRKLDVWQLAGRFPRIPQTTVVVNDDYNFVTYSSYVHGISLESVNDFLIKNGDRLVFDEKRDVVPDIVFKNDGQVVQPQVATLEYRIDLVNHWSKDNKVFLRPGFVLNGTKIDNYTSSWLMMMSCCDKINEVMRWLHGKGRRSDSFLTGALEVVGTPRNKSKYDLSILTKVFAGLDGGDTVYARSKIRTVYDGLWKESRLEPTLVIMGNGGPYRLKRDGIRAWKFFDLTQKFSQCSLTSSSVNMVPEIECLKQEFYELFNQLADYLKEHDIAFYFEQKKLILPKFSIAMDAHSYGDDFDWFDVKPEIFANDLSLSREEALELIKGSFSREDCVYIPDAKTKALLQKILGITGSSFDFEQKNKKRIELEVQRLRIFDLIELIQANVKINLPPEEQKVLNNLMHFKSARAVELPANLSASLRNYQHEGYEWLAFLYEHRFGACLADDMGLGKTIQAITFIAGIHEGRITRASNKTAVQSKFLVVVPPSLVFNWQNEFSKFYPTLKIRLYTGAQRTNDFTNYDVVITSYDIVRNDIEELKKQKFDVIVFDEAQTIKNHAAQRTQAVYALNGNFKMCITGTPLENNVREYCSIMQLAIPGILSSEAMKGNPALLGHITQRTKPFILRRTKAEIITELPNKVENDLYFDMTDQQKKIYTAVATAIKQSIDDAYRRNTAAQAGIIALTAILRLRQICISPELVDAKSKATSPKIDYIVEQLPNIIAQGDAVLLFSQFTTTLDLLEKSLAKQKIQSVRLDGTIPINKRKKIVESFEKEDGPAVMLLSLKVGGVGLNLTRSNYVIHVDPWWNPAVENQATDRAHRLGQKKAVTVMRLIMRHSIEEKMMMLKQRKQELFDAIMAGTSKQNGVNITKEDFDFLLE